MVRDLLEEIFNNSHMMKYKLLTIVVTLICTSLQAKSITFSLDTIKVEDKNINYRLTSDANNLYLNINTTDRGNMMAMIRSGISVYFDVKGKKKKNVYVKYPINSKKREYRDGRTSERKRTELSELIVDLPKKAEYSYFENTQQFHTELNTQDIRLGFEYLKNERILAYNLKIPKEQILTDSKLDLSKLSIGVVIGGKVVNRQSQRGNQQMKGSSGARQRGGGRGISGGGSRGVSGGGRRQQNGTNSQQRERPSNITIDFWFDAISKK